MEMSPYVEALQEDLEAAAALSADEATRQAAARLVGALEPSLRLRLLDALTDAALEVTAQLPEGQVEVRLAGREPELVYRPEEPGPVPVGAEDAATARITLRLPEQLKASVESAAARDGVSVNTWLIGALSRAVEPRRRGGGRRLTGYAHG